MAVIELPDHVVIRLRTIAASECVRVDEWISRMLDVEPELRMLAIEAESARSGDWEISGAVRTRLAAALRRIGKNLRHANGETPGQDEAGPEWETGIAREWSDELSDPREDIYNFHDGEPVNAAG